MKKIIAVSSVAALMMSALPVLASSISVSNNNAGTAVMNQVMVGSSTGKNTIIGGNGGYGGSSGEASVSGGSKNTAISGEGGNGGASSVDGLIVTGDAKSASGIESVVNTTLNEITVSSCGCEESEGRHRSRRTDWSIEVGTSNTDTLVGDEVAVGSETGLNAVLAGYGSNGGGTGAAYVGSTEQTEGRHRGHHSEEGGNTAVSGNGGMGGESTTKAVITTGGAVSGSSILNVVNSIITRIMK